MFDELSGSRQYSMDGSPLPVPLSEILAYLEIYKIHDIDSRDRLVRAVRSMDSVLLDFAHKKRKAAAQAATAHIRAKKPRL